MSDNKKSTNDNSLPFEVKLKSVSEMKRSESVGRNVPRIDEELNDRDKNDHRSKRITSIRIEKDPPVDAQDPNLLSPKSRDKSRRSKSPGRALTELRAYVVEESPDIRQATITTTNDNAKKIAIKTDIEQVAIKSEPQVAKIKRSDEDSSDRSNDSSSIKKRSNSVVASSILKPEKHVVDTGKPSLRDGLENFRKDPLPSKKRLSEETPITANADLDELLEILRKGDTSNVKINLDTVLQEELKIKEEEKKKKS